jgi:hypothetical protein
MEWSPSPRIIRYPHPFIVVGPNPVSIGFIRLKSGGFRRNPAIAIFGIIYPFPVRTEFIIKCLVRNIDVDLGGSFISPGAPQHYQESQSRDL